MFFGEMYLLPEILYLNELIGQQINMICIGPYDAQVKFEKGLTIQALHKLEAIIDGKKSLWFDGEWLNSEQLLNAVGKEVTNIIRTSDYELQIALSDKVTLCFHTEESLYESIIIITAEGQVDVI